ncbi:hypothetical protein M9Y10_039706 [Tritrichomonas musculus]|uniref:DUF3447 domain-containing protein n=1 Tax=Tritrichomonas musculus TaxID=1915356 RepID=A0ABR2GR09_9EUKA
MSLEECLGKMKKIQENLLDYLNDEANYEVKFQCIVKKCDEIKNDDKISKIKSMLHLLSKISDNYHYTADFFNKINRVLQLFKDEMKKKFTNIDIFNIFKRNKRILLFLFDEKIITFDEKIAKMMTKDKYMKSEYPSYFSPEIKPFVKSKWFPKDGLTSFYIENDEWLEDKCFYEKRKNGQNDDLICQFIQKDLIDDFITYVNKNSYSLKYKIKSSIYETNNFLLEKEETTLIEYAAFYGSIQIFNYLRLNGIELTSSLWNFAIHGKNAEIIHLLEENHIQPPKCLNKNKDDISYEKIFIESIKCHHNDIANYIQNNFLNKKSKEILISAIKFCNYEFIQNIDIIDDSAFYFLCKYDYDFLVTILSKRTDIDINKLIVIYEKKKYLIQF